MTDNRVYEVIIETLGIDRAAFDESSKIEDICKDSIQIFSLIMAFEKKFGQKVDYDDLVNIETVGDIMRLVERLGNK